MKLCNIFHPDLLTAQKLAYEPIGFIWSNLTQEAESQDYGAYTFKMNNQHITFRVAKVTPTKIGQFVTLWKRIGCGPIMPYDIADTVDLFVVSVRDKENLGQFVFPKNLLHEKGFVAKNGSGGKRAMRVYPPWNIPDSPQATKTQTWQLAYFAEIQPATDTAKLQKLYWCARQESNLRPTD